MRHFCHYFPNTFPIRQGRLLGILAIFLLVTGCQSNLAPKNNAPIDSGMGAEYPAGNIHNKSASKNKKTTDSPEESDTEGELDELEEIVISDLWLRIKSGLGMNLSQTNRRIQTELKWYKKNQSYFNRISTRASPYLHFIVQEAEARNLPLELALMPVVESAFDPFAYSHAGASGLWQIMPATGEHFGLEQNWWYDGRRDIVAATRMALDYMQSLYDMFDDWELALAAYNSGPGRVQNAIRKNKRLGKSTQFWYLDLPNETTAYVPKLIALGKIVQSPAKYGIELPPIANTPYFETVDTKGQLDMAKAAKLADIPLDQLYRLNPGLNRWSTPPKGPHYLALPIEKAGIFSAKLSSLPSEKRMKWQRYAVKSGDSLNKIAKQYRTQVKLIKEVNRLDSNIIRIGQSLLIPVPAQNAEDYSLTLAQRRLSQQNRGVSGRQKYTYIVKPGDSFWTISRKYNVVINELARWNNMAPKDPLKINQKLVVWQKATKRSTNNVVKRVNYKVRQGDSLSLIADKFNIHINEIRDWNTLDEKYIHPGQQLTLYVDVTRAYD